MKSENWNEIKNITNVELSSRLRELQDRLFKLKFRHSSVPLKNPLEIRETRRIIARIKTLIVLKKN
jgi:large subunit ribosomal protein L29